MEDLGWRVEQQLRDLTGADEDEDEIVDDVSMRQLRCPGNGMYGDDDDGLSSDTVSNPDLKQRDSPRTNPDLNYRDTCRESPQKRNPLAPPRLPFPMAASFLSEDTLELVHGSAGSAQAVLFFRMASMDSGSRSGGKATFFGIHFRQVANELLVTDTVARWIRAVKSEKLAALFERLRSGYKLESVNDMSIRSLDLSTLYCMFRGKPGSHVKLSFVPVERDAQQIRSDDFTIADDSKGLKNESARLSLIYLVSEKVSRSVQEPSSPTSRGDYSFDSIRDAFLKRDRELERLRRTNDALCLRIREMEEEGQDLVVHVEKEMDRLVSKVCDSWQQLEHQLSKEALCTVRAEQTLDLIEHNMELIRIESQNAKKQIEKLQIDQGFDFSSTRNECWKEIDEARAQLTACEKENSELKKKLKLLCPSDCKPASTMWTTLSLLFIFLMCFTVPWVVTLHEYHSRQCNLIHYGVHGVVMNKMNEGICDLNDVEYNEAMLSKSEEIYGELRWRLASNTFHKRQNAGSILGKISELQNGTARRVACLKNEASFGMFRTGKEVQDCKKIRDSLHAQISAVTSQAKKDSVECNALTKKLQSEIQNYNDLNIKAKNCKESIETKDLVIKQIQLNNSALFEQNRNLTALVKACLQDKDETKKREMESSRLLSTCRLDMIASQRDWKNALQQVAQLTEGFTSMKDSQRMATDHHQYVRTFDKKLSYCGFQKFSEDEPPHFPESSECSKSNEGLNSMFMEVPMSVCAQVPTRDNAAFDGCLPGHVPIIYNDNRFFSSSTENCVTSKEWNDCMARSEDQRYWKQPLACWEMLFSNRTSKTQGKRICSAQASRERVWVKVKSSHVNMSTPSFKSPSSLLLVQSRERIPDIQFERDHFDEFWDMGDEVLKALQMRRRENFVPLTSERRRHVNIPCPPDFDCELWERHSIVTVTATDLFGKHHVLYQWTFIEEPHSTFTRMRRKEKKEKSKRRRHGFDKYDFGRLTSLKLSLLPELSGRTE
ncbi:hypothetical protein GUITHDRAFT_120419 [Guillardia theta CCMP2712]|uniref:Uncharacterized protein n=2 Tax=Guillardia theta TaxID=55529 RepID=L1IC48_GUITC|nr:hypothetical protein GUITHDRAFT_120419 [Guillardia theta CCMP2712]EKX33415.1 hypothetical protein GUITHDRAFT_120419 [Guillardia theta CCMP2712]|eukprot:XP_005820395.1 hypothetical protein GUITHDRAFT_120419 [Guillardia theta CCMP2712]